MYEWISLSKGSFWTSLQPYLHGTSKSFILFLKFFSWQIMNMRDHPKIYDHSRPLQLIQLTRCPRVNTCPVQMVPFDFKTQEDWNIFRRTCRLQRSVLGEMDDQASPFITFCPSWWEQSGAEAFESRSGFLVDSAADSGELQVLCLKISGELVKKKTPPAATSHGWREESCWHPKWCFLCDPWGWEVVVISRCTKVKKQWRHRDGIFRINTSKST